MRGKEETVPKLVPYEMFLLRRLQQAQRRAGDAAVDGAGAVVRFVRPPKVVAGRRDDGFGTPIAEVP